MCDTFKEEFSLSRLGLSHNSRDDFISCRWKWRHPAFYIIYRLVIAAYVTAFFLTTVVLFSQDGNNDFMAYLTMWTYLMLTLYFLLSAITVICYSCFRKAARQNGQGTTLYDSNKTQNEALEGCNNIAFAETDLKHTKADGTIISNGFSDKSQNNVEEQIIGNESLLEAIPLLMKVCWVIGNVVQVFAVVVTLVYFTALFPQIGYTNCIDINLHGANTFFVIVDTCLHRRPVRLLHVIHPVIYGGCYLIFSGIYWSFDHVNNVLYPGVLDWNYPGTTTLWVVGLTLVVVPLLQLVHFGAYRLKLHIYRRG